MSQPCYWYLGTSPISVPYWSDVAMCEAEFGDDRVVAPMLFTTREKADAELRRHDRAGQVFFDVLLAGSTSTSCASSSFTSLPSSSFYASRHQRLLSLTLP
jgi:hypothetical protein